MAGTEARFVWTDETTLAEHDVFPWSDLPLFTGSGAPGLATRNGAKALAAGMIFRPVEETIRDTLDWARARPDAGSPRAGLSEERECAVLEKLSRDRSG